MKLSLGETRFIERCRGAGRQWPFARWLTLALAVGFWAVSAHIVTRLTTPGGRVGTSDAGLAFEEDVFWFMNLGCVAVATFVLIRCRGDRRTSLLLKLVELHQREGSQPSDPRNGGPQTPPGSPGVVEGAPPVR
jgi:hypothetical protein